MEARTQIFLSYAREDEEEVKRLYQRLSNAGFKPWMDKKDILPGEIWESCIQKAIRNSDFFLACLSANSVDKRGFIQKEIREALDVWQEKLDSDIYLIPVRLEDCEVPESLRKFQWVDLLEEDSLTLLMKAIHVGLERRTKVIKPAVQESMPSEPHPVREEPLPISTTDARAAQHELDIPRQLAYQSEEPDEAISHYRWIVDRGDWDPDIQEQALRELLKFYVDRKKWQSAVETALRRIDVLSLTELSEQYSVNDLEKTGREELAQLYVRWAEDDVALGNLEGAVDSYKEAEQVYRKIGDWQGVQEIQSALAETYERWAEVQAGVHQWADAVGYYRSALTLYEELKRPAKIALIWYRLGHLRKEQRRKYEALTCFEMSLSYRKDHSGEFLVPFEIILSAHDESIKTRLKRREFHHAVLQLCEKADDLIVAGLAQDAVASAQEALRLSKKIRAPELVLASRRHLGHALGESGKLEQATNEYQTALELTGALGDEDARNDILYHLDQLQKMRRWEV